MLVKTLLISLEDENFPFLSKFAASMRGLLSTRESVFFVDARIGTLKDGDFPATKDATAFPSHGSRFCCWGFS